MKVFICCKTLLFNLQIQINVYKNQKPRTPYLIARGNLKKTLEGYTKLEP